jgi:radical SAM superfamily enzyme YgiQ (UPF0313 family)
MRKVILVQPKVGDWDDFRSHPSLPLSLLSAARLVANEFEVIFIDSRVDKDWKNTLRDKLAENPICVGITSMTGRQISHALEISRFVKQVSNAPVVWGGIHCSLLPDSTLENNNIDLIVLGEGEVKFLELVRALNTGRDLRGVKGIWFKQDQEIIRNPEREFVELNDLPVLPLSLIDLKHFLPIFKGRRTFYIETSRGCPNRCGFCYNLAFHKSSWRAFPAERVVRRLKYLSKEYKIGSFYIIDDNFFVDLKRAKEIAQGIIDEKLDIFWEVQGITINSALKMDDDYLELMVRSGLKKVHFGVESGSERILKMVNKNLNIDNVLKVNKDWNKYNIITQYNFMCGFPGETKEDIRETTKLVFRLMRENPRALISPLCPYTPYPGTALYQNDVNSGFSKKSTLEDWVEANYGDNLWESKERKDILSALFFTSMFLDSHRSKDMISSKMMKVLIDLYRPVARFRIKHLFFKFMPELKIKEIFLA